MDRSEIAALAKGVVPFVRDVVAEALAPLAVRLAELEARPREKGDAGPPGPEGPPGSQGLQGPKGDCAELSSATLPSELAEQVAGAARLLHELPVLVALGKAAPARIVRIERDENGALVPIYDTSREDGVSTPGAQP
jgi:hypothetical protein